ncbi:MAG: NUDIX hydrolase [Bacillota bacterium]
MNIKHLQSVLKERHPKPDGDYQEFSIFVPLVHVNDELQLLFEVRSETLRNQPGEICFPGGRIEKFETPEQAALRETSEELNISLTLLEVLAPLDYIVTPFNVILYPFLGTLNIQNMDEIQFNRDEVAEIFTVPLSFFINQPPITHYINITTSPNQDFPFDMIQNGERYNWRVGKYPVLFYEYQDKIIWGMTARIVKSFIESIK